MLSFFVFVFFSLLRRTPRFKRQIVYVCTLSYLCTKQRIIAVAVSTKKEHSVLAGSWFPIMRVCHFCGCPTSPWYVRPNQYSRAQGYQEFPPPPVAQMSQGVRSVQTHLSPVVVRGCGAALTAAAAVTTSTNGSRRAPMPPS